MNLVKLSTILLNMNQFQTVSTVDEPTKVRWVDMALRDDEIDYKLPFRRKQSSLRVFDGVLVYPAPSDYDELCYVDNDEMFYADRARFRYQSFNEFFEDKDNRNDLCEIMDGETTFIGCRYQTKSAQSITVDPAENAALYTCSGDASNPVLDNVFFKEGNGSIRFSIISNTGTAMIENTFTNISDSLYTRKYNFRYVYLSGLPTAISMRYGNDNADYLYFTATKQFSGQDFKINSWNLVAFDLNTASTVGTIDATKFAYQGLILTGAPTGTYYVDTSYVRSWELLDNFWYYHINAVKTNAGVYQTTFIGANTEDYDVTDYLIGTLEFANYIAYRASLMIAMDKGDDKLIPQVGALQKTSGEKIPQRYQMVKPIMTNLNWRFKSNPMSGYNRGLYGPRNIS